MCSDFAAFAAVVGERSSYPSSSVYHFTYHISIFLSINLSLTCERNEKERENDIRS